MLSVLSKLSVLSMLIVLRHDLAAAGEEYGNRDPCSESGTVYPVECMDSTTDAAGVPIPHYYMLAWRYGQHAIVHRRLGRENLTPFGERPRETLLT